MIIDKGNWTFGVDTETNTKVYVESQDFNHDVRLYVNGDFETIDDTKRYAAGIALQLNFASGHAVENTQNPDSYNGNTAKDLYDRLYKIPPQIEDKVLVDHGAINFAITVLEQTGHADLAKILGQHTKLKI